MTVLATTLVAILQAYTSSAKSTQITDQYFQALILSQSLMAETLTDTNLSPMKKSGRYLALGWRVEITPVRRDWSKIPDKASWQLFNVSVTITWPPERQYQLQTMKLGPRNG